MHVKNSKPVARICFVIFTSVLLGAFARAQQFDPQGEQELVRLVNLERARQGLPSVKLDDHLRQAARAHSALMARKNTLSHQLPGEPPLPKRLAATNLRFNNDGENVGYNGSIQGAHEGFMHSPPHRANILSPDYNTIGVGVVRSGDLYWVTEDFAHRLEDYSRDEAEDTIIANWERERQRAHRPKVQAVRMKQLRKIACDMGKHGHLNTRAALRLPNVLSAVSYTAPDPSKLPSSAVQAAHDANLRRMAVGACFAADAKYPAGTWWVVMTFY